eukprot:Transcript_32011.p1 GENE.Transcript_32011~~Transcript_32011.p1  ORF type:complete len:383 (-),score=124.97 Transcript_32011:202-1350(-)
MLKTAVLFALFTVAGSIRWAAVSRTSAPSRRGAVLCSANQCPLTGLELPPCPFSSDSGTAADSSSTGPPSAFDAATALERRVQDALGVDVPLVCSALSVALESVLAATADELGSLSVTFNASSTLGLATRGELDSVRVRVNGWSSGGLRASEVEIDGSDLRLVPINPLAQQLPNLARPAELTFRTRFSQDDLNRSPVLFALLQELLRELLRSGISAAIGEVLPRDSSLRFDLTRVEALQEGRVVLQADAEATAADGTRTTLQGLRVRTFVRLSQGMILLVSPELVSSFEGFGAKVELGLPFLRGAGIPVPEPLRLRSLLVDNGGIDVRGSVVLQPIDYADLASALSDLQEAAQSTPQAVSADPDVVDVAGSEDTEGYGLMRP